MEAFRDYLSKRQTSQLLVIVNQSIDNLHKAANVIISEFNIPCHSLNAELSQLLINKPKETFSREIISWLTEKKRDISNDSLILIDIELLFEPSFKLDPLTIFKQARLNKMLIVFWPGNFINNNLTYASPEHAHFRRWVNPGIEIIQL